MENFKRCICCGGVLGEIEGGKILPVMRRRSQLLKDVDYIGICGDCLINAEEDDDEVVEKIEIEGEKIA